ncbi:MAG: hypothetical protein Q8934_11030 [Bacillota bacterium]|nr:hypothetical protein [Bacillota bacterium]
MWFRIFFWLIGLGCSIAGGICCIAYMNFLTTGRNTQDYFIFLINRPEVFLLPIGLVIITFSIYSPNKNRES